MEFRAEKRREDFFFLLPLLSPQSGGFPPIVSFYCWSLRFVGMDKKLYTTDVVYFHISH